MPDSRDYPRVLVIDSTPFCHHNGNGILKSLLFRGWPKDRLAQIDYSNIQPGFDVCEQYWRLNKLDILKGLAGFAPYSTVNKLVDLNEGVYDPQRAFEYESRSAIERIFSGVSLQLRAPVGEAIFRLPSVLSGPLRAWIAVFRPDVVFSLTGSGLMLRTVTKVAQWRGIPVVPYFTDDWVTTLHKDAFLGRWMRRSMMFWLYQCLSIAPSRLATSDFMTQEYAQRYGGQFETFMVPAEASDILVRKQRSESSDTVQFLFIGSLGPDKRWESLQRIGEALCCLRREGIKGELLIYTFPTEIEQFGNYLTLEPVMRVMGTAAPGDVPSLQRSADVLVHVESFERAKREYTRLSLSTKISQYMMAGACIFAYGPGEIASLRYIADSGVGVVVGQEEPQALLSALRELVTSEEMRRSFGARARALALERHEATRERERFRQTMVRVCRASEAITLTVSRAEDRRTNTTDARERRVTGKQFRG